MSDVSDCITSALRERAGGRRLKVGVFGRSDASAVAAVVAEGHRTLVMSDSFRFLFSLSKRIGTGARGGFSLLESTFADPPIAPRSLDAVVLAGGMRAGAEPLATLVGLGDLLVPGGLLIWPNPTSDGSLGGLGSVFAPFRRGMIGALPRERLCALAMSAGYGEVGQRLPRRTAALPWVITTGVIGICRG